MVTPQNQKCLDESTYLNSPQTPHVKNVGICYLSKTNISKFGLFGLSSKTKFQSRQFVFLLNTKEWSSAKPKFESWKYVVPPSKKQVPNFGHIRFSSNPILKVGQNRTFEVVHFCLFIKTQIAKLEILASSKTRGCLFVLFSGYHVRASFGFEAVRPRHKEKGLGVRGVAKTKFQRSRNYHCSKDIF